MSMSTSTRTDRRGLGAAGGRGAGRRRLPARRRARRADRAARRADCALRAAEIEDALKAGEGRGVARAAIYRILEELEALQLITRVEVGQGLARFEAAREEGHHHHMVCDDCGQVIPFEDPELERSIDGWPSASTFTVAEHDVVLHGACARLPR